MSIVDKQRMKRLIKWLNDLPKGNATSMITLVIAPGTQLSQVNDNIKKEKGDAANVQSRVNRQSILSALESITQKLKMYHKCPPNGLVLFCGEGAEQKKIMVAVEPLKPINTRDYWCGKEFKTDVLEATIDDDTCYGFIIIDGSGVLFAKLDGQNKTILPNGFTVDLPKKHGRGGQSALRFARLRLEKRHNYLTKVKDECVKCFITDNLPNVKGIVVAGIAELKHELIERMDPRLRAVIIEVIDLAYGHTDGLKQAIALTADRLVGLKLSDEIRILKSFFDEIQTSSGKYVYGLTSVHALIGSGAIETVIVWENYKELYPDDTINAEADEADAAVGRIDGKVEYIDWLLDNYQNYGCSVQIISDKSSEGEQFIKGFSGIGAILRYPVDEEVLLPPLPDIGEVDIDDYM